MMIKFAGSASAIYMSILNKERKKERARESIKHFYPYFYLLIKYV